MVGVESVVALTAGVVWMVWGVLHSWVVLLVSWDCEALPTHTALCGQQLAHRAQVCCALAAAACLGALASVTGPATGTSRCDVLGQSQPTFKGVQAVYMCLYVCAPRAWLEQ